MHAVFYPVFCDSIAVRLTKIMVHFTSAMLFVPVHGGCYFAKPLTASRSPRPRNAITSK